jgi:hypothetical protein
MSEYSKLMSELKLIKQAVCSLEHNHASIGGWLPKKAVMRFLDYSDNQLRILERSNILQMSKIGRRKFYSLESILELIEKNKQ